MLTKQQRRAERILRAMAFNRQTFTDKLQFILSGALTHYYMVELARLNGQTKWVQHWKNEVERLINFDTVQVLVANIKGKWDKKKALEESLSDVRTADSGYRRIAANYVAKVYQLKKTKQNLPAGVEDEFYEMVHETAERALRPDV
jgi:hypothetical protein